jgi:hypothetical protein
MNIINDNQLKQLLAKMLLETVAMLGTSDNILCWVGSAEADYYNRPTRVLVTELLHLCSLAEAGLTVVEACSYFDLLRDIGPDNEAAGAFAYHATWQQRVTALAAVKGVTL